MASLREGNVPRRVTTATTWQKDEGARPLVVDRFQERFAHPRHSGFPETFAKPADPSPSRSVRGREPAQRSSQGMPDQRLNPLQFPLGHQGGGFAKVPTFARMTGVSQRSRIYGITGKTIREAIASEWKTVWWATLNSVSDQ